MTTTYDCIDQLEYLDAAILKYADIIGDEARRLRYELNIDKPQHLRETLAGMIEDNRVLHVGIVGRVKAGKSSLLNSLFFDGETVLPKAATPMTAALTSLSWGENFSAVVEFFNNADMEEINAEHIKHKRLMDVAFQKVLTKLHAHHEKEIRKPSQEDLEDRARKRAESETRTLPTFAAYDQYKRILSSGRTLNSLGTAGTRQIQAQDLQQLLTELQNYVGAGGELMPFTKCVHIKLPHPSLQGLNVVDTPGINDPVKSREQRTEDYLKKCDVVFIVSPAGQFLTREDMALMDRLYCQEGVRELFLIASQVDMQLHGDTLEKCGGNLHAALETVRKDLTAHAASVLSTTKKNHPEISSVFDQLINDGANRVLVTSSLAFSALKHFHDREAWDEDVSHMIHQLTKNYPDDFPADESGVSNLETLANLAKIKDNLDYIRGAKEQILKEKQTAYLTQLSAKTSTFQEKLITQIEEIRAEVKNSDLTTVEKQKQDLTRLINHGKENTGDALLDQFNQFMNELRCGVQNLIKAIRSTESEVSDKLEDKTETVGDDLHGILGFIKYLFVGSDTKTNEYKSVETAAVKARLCDCTRDMQHAVKQLSGMLATVEWKNKVQRNLLQAIEGAGCHNYVDLVLIKKAIRALTVDLPIIGVTYNKDASNQSVSKLVLPPIYESFTAGPNSKSFKDYSGEIRDGDAIAFMGSVTEYLSHLKERLDADIEEYIRRLEVVWPKNGLFSLLFEEMHNQINTLEEQIKTKQVTIERLDALKKMINEGRSA